MHLTFGALDAFFFDYLTIVLALRKGSFSLKQLSTKREESVLINLPLTV